MKVAQVSFQGRRASFLIENPEDHIEACWLTKKFYEEDLLRFVFHYTMPGMRLLDVGAHYGNHSIFFSKVIGQRAIAIEASADAFRRLSANVAHNKCQDLVEVRHFAASNHRGKAFNRNDDPKNSGKNRIYYDDAGDTLTSTLDAEISGPIDILKIDVEGRELDVLVGADSLVCRYRPLILAECQNDSDFNKIRHFLKRRGYRPSMRFCWTPTYVFVHSRMTWRNLLFLPWR